MPWLSWVSRGSLTVSQFLHLHPNKARVSMAYIKIQTLVPKRERERDPRLRGKKRHGKKDKER